MKFADLPQNKTFKLTGDDSIYTKKNHSEASCCTPANNAWKQEEGKPKRTFVLIPLDTEIEEVS